MITANMPAAELKPRLLAEIDARRDDLIALTQDLVRIPTVNPPGNNYLEICEYLARRLKKRGYAVELIRAEGAIGDVDKHPRWNIVARREGGHAGETVHFNSHHDVVEVGRGWTTDPFGGELRDGRVYGRGTCDMKGGLASSIIAAEAFCRPLSGLLRQYRDFGHGGRRDRRLRRRRLPGGEGLFLARAGAARHHPRAPEQGSHLPRPSRRAGGRRSRRSGESRMARCRSSATAPSATWRRCCTSSRRCSIRR